MRNRKKFYNNFDTHLIVRFSIFIIFFLLVLGCGKKAPPVPPRQTKSQTANDVCASTDGGAGKLSLATLREKCMIMSSLSGLIVYSSKRLHSDSNFKNFSVFFKYISDSLIEVSASEYMKKLLLYSLNPLKRL